MKRIFICFIFFLLSSISTQAARIYGKITDAKQQGLPFVTVYAQGTSYGTAANAEGQYFIELPKGNYTLIFRLVGYKSELLAIDVTGNDLEKNITLTEESLLLNEIRIVAGAEDPAMAIMRKAIAKRKFYLEQVEGFSCHYYTKGNNRILKAPKKILGKEVNISNMDSASGAIVYLSESVSEYYFKKPNKSKEIMIAAKTSGQPNGFSWNSAAAMQTNFYENLVQINQLNTRGFISPVASNALFYYKYKLLGTFSENGILINKIELLPRRNSDPVFRGVIYIQEDTWRIHSSDLLLTKEANLEFVDTLSISQTFVPISDAIWLPSLQKFEFKYSVLGFVGVGLFVGSGSEFKLNPDYPKGFFSNEVMKIEPLANKKTSTYWDSVRVVPLTNFEQRDYRIKDSMQVIKESKPYMDSLDEKSNKPSWGNLLLGYTYSNRYKNYRLTVASPINTIAFNAVEGWLASPEISFSRRNKETYKAWRYTQTLRYGLTSERFYSKGSLYRLYNPRRMASWNIDGGHFISQMNEEEPVSPIGTTLALLRVQYNAARLYQKSFGAIAHRSEISNGLKLYTQLLYARRQELVNATSLAKADKYAANNALLNIFHEPDGLINFSTNNIAQLTAALEIRFKQEYMSHPLAKYTTGDSKWPVLTLEYRKAIPNIFSSSPDFDFASANIRHTQEMGLFGTAEMQMEHGRFLNNKNVPFNDRQHFLGNRILLVSNRINHFINLPYYAYSTQRYYSEAHYLHHFKGFFLNKIPLVRKLKWHETAGINVLHVPNTNGTYVEWFAGAENIFKILRVEYAQSYVGGQYAGSRIIVRMGFE